MHECLRAPAFGDDILQAGESLAMPGISLATIEASEKL
jgi:hypothetical protein